MQHLLALLLRSAPTTLAVTGVVEPITFAARFEDVTTVCQAVQDGSGESLGTEHLGPLLERQVRRDDHTRSLIGRADYVKEQLAPQFACRVSSDNYFRP